HLPREIGPQQWQDGFGGAGQPGPGNGHCPGRIEVFTPTGGILLQRAIGRVLRIVVAVTGRRCRAGPTALVDHESCPDTGRGFAAGSAGGFWMDSSTAVSRPATHAPIAVNHDKTAEG